ncbi:cadherin domain-containing protein [Tenacibaculum crassostreae]|uniref:cadherin domain-containing protein n=1 Tax=Tenacibaculum crassostreae TaxID=502683 RepID=UPI003892DC11
MEIKNYLKVFPLALLLLTSCDKDEELNTAPVIENQTFEVLESIASNQKIADVVAIDKDEDELIFSIKENDADLFQITEAGELSVVTDKNLDFETTTSHKITIEVTDGEKAVSAEITINVTDVDENEAPAIENQTFTVAEDISDTAIIGTVVATDPNGDDLSYTVSDANFEITSSGELSLVEGKQFDYETKTEHKLTVEVSDGAMTASAEITIKVTDVDENEAPVIENQTFTVAEDISDRAIIGTVVATDPNGDDLSYTVSGAADFEITSSGELSLVGGKQLDYETKTSHVITVEVSDGAMTSSAEITIKVTDVDENEAPVIENQTFTVAEDISATDLIGQVVATDDGGVRLSFVMKADADNLFRIFDNGTLYLIEGKQLDYETKTSHVITVEVSDGEKTATANITINVTDVVEDTVVNIPDANFKQALVGNNSINTNGDSEIQVSEAEAYTGFISVGGKAINDLTGIEYFTNINSLSIHNNNLTTVDLSKNVNLVTLYTYNNRLTGLDVSKNVLLEDLRCTNNGLTSLDLTSNTLLKYLTAEKNNLTSLDLTKNTYLQGVSLEDNKLTTIDFSSNSRLSEVYLSRNNLTSLDVSNKVYLTTVRCTYNSITTLNIKDAPELSNLRANNNQLTKLDTSTNTKLKLLELSHNQITNLDFSNNSSLTSLNVYNNASLVKVNISNGNNSLIAYFFASNCPNLTCIQIDADFKPDPTKWFTDNADSYTYTACP